MAQDKDATAAVADANTRFGLKVVRSVAAGEFKTNQLFSPLAVSSALALLQNGASSQCQQQLLSTLELGDATPQDVNAGYGALLPRVTIPFTPPPKPTKQRPKATSPPVVGWAPPPPDWYLHSPATLFSNSFWTKSPAWFTPVFLETNRRYYQAELATFRTPADARLKMGRWAQRATQGGVTAVPAVDRDEDFVLLGISFFRAFWRDKFPRKDTHPGDFTLLSGQTKKVQMMVLHHHLGYLETPQFQAVVLRYARGQSMYVFLPARELTLHEFEAQLTPEHWKEWAKAMGSREGTLEMPKYRIEAHTDVRSLMAALGASCPFESFAALLPAVTIPEGAKLTRATQDFNLSVDEDGTEAIVVTSLGGVMGGVMGGVIKPPPPPFHMVVDRPFFFAIVDDQSKTLLFVGSIVDP